MKYAFLVNPASGQGKHDKGIVAEVEDLIKGNPNRDIKLYYTRAEKDATYLAGLLAEESSMKNEEIVIFACGGDGTVQEVANGIYGHENAILGVIPVGSGKLLDKMPFRVRVVANNRNPETKTQLVSKGYLDASHAFVNLSDNEEYPILYPIETSYGVSNFQARRMLLDMDTYLPEDILVKMDRASMRYSLENRCPIMDTDVMEYSFRIPHKFKYYNGDKKHILKDIAYDYIPRDLLERPKTGFGVPMDAWLRGPLKEALIDYSSTSFLKQQGIFDVEYVSKFINDYIVKGDGGPATGANYSKIAWSFFIFQQWYNYYMV